DTLVFAGILTGLPGARRGAGPGRPVTAGVCEGGPRFAKDPLCHVAGLTLGGAPAAAHGELMLGQPRAFEDREAGLLWQPGALAQLHRTPGEPCLDQVADLGWGHVEAANAVRELM